MLSYGGRDWRARGKEPYKNLDEQRRDNNKAQARAKEKLTTRIVIGVGMVLLILLERIPPDFSGSFAEVFPIVAWTLFAVIPVIAGVLVLAHLRRKQKREAVYSNEAPRFDSQYEDLSQSEERYTANTSSIRDYSGAVDSWDIKDPKPPWEL